MSLLGNFPKPYITFKTDKGDVRLEENTNTFSDKKFMLVFEARDNSGWCITKETNITPDKITYSDAEIFANTALGMLIFGVYE